MKPVTSTIVHIPHASRTIPDDVRSSFCLRDRELEDELDRLTDHYTDEQFSIENDSVSVRRYPVSRYVADLERFSDDNLEPMSKYGQGAVYVRTVDGGVLRRRCSVKDRARLLNDYYWPHHRRLEALTSQALEASGSVLIIDAHSFPSRPLPVDLDQHLERPDICIGTDGFHTPDSLVELLTQCFVEEDLSVSVNKPYAGTIVPLQYYGKDSRVKSVMIEINRSLYLCDEPVDISKKEPEFSQLQNILKRIITQAQ